MNSASRSLRRSCILLAAVLCALSNATALPDDLDNPEPPRVVTASKVFTESVILGEMIRILAEDASATAYHQAELGGTQLVWQSLLNGDVDVYPEYTGTISQQILHRPELTSLDELREAVQAEGLQLSDSLGFNNTYALGMKRSRAEQLGIRTFSDLKNHPELSFGFSNEFMERNDGWPGLRDAYDLPQKDVRGLHHDLAYRALESGDLDVIDLYSTDAEISYYDLAVLEDDRDFFPRYDAVLVYRSDLPKRAPAVMKSLQRLVGAISAKQMSGMNERAKIDRQSEARVAADFLRAKLGIAARVESESRWQRLLRYTREHLYLVGLSVTAAIVVAVPLGIWAAKIPWAGHVILAVVGILQTIPALALFVFAIPLLGLGPRPAICALFLYSLLPIVRNTHAGLGGIPVGIHESAAALGLTSSARMRLIELPMASRSILAGIKTAVVINIGTATLGGFIAAGGYGEPIITGIRLNRMDLVQDGAVPAALMALCAQGLFELSERWLVPRGLRLRSES